MQIDQYISGEEPAFQHVAPSARPYFDVIDGEMQPPIQIRSGGVPLGRDFNQSFFTTKGYEKEVLSGECILMGLINGSFAVRGVTVRASLGGECASFTNIKTGEPALEVKEDGEECEKPLDECILELGEKSAAWPATDLYLVRLDCPCVDKDGTLAGVPLSMGAEGSVDFDELGARAVGKTAAGSLWGVVAVPSADVPDLASLWVDVEIANPRAL